MFFEFLVITSKCQKVKLVDYKCDKCKIEYINQIRNKPESASYESVLNFLCTFDENCINNAEFSEYSNETLFLILSIKPNVVIEIFDKYVLSTEYILKNIKNPVDDSINIEKIILEVEKVKTKSQSKLKILNALKRK